MGAPPSALDAPLRRDVAICVEGRAHRIGVWTTEHGEHRHYLPLCYYDGLAPPVFPPRLSEGPNTIGGAPIHRNGSNGLQVVQVTHGPLTCLACLARDFPH